MRVLLILVLLVLPVFSGGIDVDTARPRIYLSANPPAGTPSLAALRARAQLSPFLERRAELTAVASDTGYYDMVNNALAYLLYNDTAAANRALALLQTQRHTSVSATYDEEHMLDAAVAFDWLFKYPRFTPAQKSQVAYYLRTYANACYSYLTGGGHIWHTRTVGAAAALGVIGLALSGYDSTAPDLLNKARAYWTQGMFPALEYLDGSVTNGVHYGVYHGVRDELFFLKAWKSATGEDFFARYPVVRRQFDFFLYNIRPDLGWEKTNEMWPHSWMTFAQSRCIVDMFNHEYRTPDGAWMSKRLRDFWGWRDYQPNKRDSLSGWNIVHGSMIYAYFLWHAPEVAPGASLSLPRYALFGRESAGHAFFRSDWSDTGICFYYKCGDYFENHGYYDQGMFNIFMGAPLAVRLGQYDDAGAMCANTVVFNSWGGQRQPNSQSSRTLTAYLGAKVSQGLETGDIEIFRANDTTAYLSSDLTSANRSSECLSHYRDILFLRNRVFIILDQIRTASSDVVPRWLLHSSNEPAITGNTIRLTNTDYAGRSWGLECRVLLPAAPAVSAVVQDQYNDLGTFGIVGLDTMRKSSSVNGWQAEVTNPAPDTALLFLTVLRPGKSGTPALANTFLASRTDSLLLVCVEGDTLYFPASDSGRFFFDVDRHIAAERRMVYSGLNQGLSLYPNPCRGQSMVTLTLHSRMQSGLPIFRIFDINGRLIKKIGSSTRKGTLFGAVWDGRDMRGNVPPQGVYQVLAEAGKEKYSGKIVYIR